MAQDLYYISSSQSLTLVNDNGQTNNWNNVTRLETSGSGYDAPISGSEFIGTVGIARIYAYSGSVVLVSFPIEGTNIYYELPNSSEGLSALNDNSLVFFNFSSISNDINLTGSYFSIYNSTLSSSYITFNNTTGSGGFSTFSGDSFLFIISGSAGYNAYLYLNDITTGSNIFTLSASNNSTSASYIPVPFHDYEVTFSVISIS
jgi:hypothetical protein